MPPSAPPIMSSGASTPPEVPEPSEKAQMIGLDEQDAEDQAAGGIAVEQLADQVVADAEGRRKDEAADADRRGRR